MASFNSLTVCSSSGLSLAMVLKSWGYRSIAGACIREVSALRLLDCFGEKKVVVETDLGSEFTRSASKSEYCKTM